MAKRKTRTGSKKGKTPQNEVVAVSANVEPLPSHNSNLAINQIPVEVFSIIVSFVLCSRTPSNPYPQMILSWVCHRWRSIILQDKSLWKTISLSQKQLTKFSKVFIQRSNPVDLIVLLTRLGGCSWESIKGGLKAAFGTDRIRVKTLFIGNGPYSCLPQLISTFPSLENVFDDTNVSNCSFNKRSQCHLKRLEGGFSGFHKSNFTQTLMNLQWLRLNALPGFSLDPFLSALQNLPNLRILHISQSYEVNTDFFHTWPTLTFPSLTTLILMKSRISNPIKASNLSYLNVLHSQSRWHHPNSWLCDFDLSAVTCIYANVCPLAKGKEPYIMGGNQSDQMESLENHLDRCRSSESNESVLNGAVASPISFPRNQFCFSSYPKLSNCITVPGFMKKYFYSCLDRSVNLVELTVNDFRSSFKPADEEDFFNHLKGVGTLRHLTVLRGGVFYDFCWYLQDGTICPLLEKLTYSGTTSRMTKNDSLLVPCLKDLMRERSLGCQSPLNTLELLRFSSLQPAVLQGIESLGIQVIQR